MENEGLHRGLEERHVNLMAIGAAVGVGLFFGSAGAIKLAGPAILAAYVAGGVAVFLIMRALGEMAVHEPVVGSFSRYAQEYVGPLTGYLTGWTYWFMWLIACMAELTAVGIYMHLWYPHVPNWSWALAALVLMGGANLAAVRFFGEFEFWFALIKVVTIILMIVSGSGMIIFGFGNHGVATGIHNLWAHGGFAPHGIRGVLAALPMVIFSYAGVEMLGLAAGEARNPSKSIARAVNSVFLRVLIFYVGSLFVMMSIYPWSEIGTQGSPFVMIFQKIGIPWAAGVMNFVVVTAALSTCNSGIFSTGRMLHSLAQQRQAFSVFAVVSKNGVPLPAIMASLVALTVGVLLNYLAPREVFSWLSSIVTFAVLWTWVTILLTQRRFRQRLTEEQVRGLALKMPLSPFSNYVGVALLLLVVLVMALTPGLRVALVVGPAWVLFLILLYYLMGYSKFPAAVADQAVH